MNDYSVKSLQGDSPILGDDDSLLLWGNAALSKLRSCSKKISKIVMAGNDSLELLLSELIIEINNFQSRERRGILSKLAISQRKYQEKHYLDFIVYLDKISVGLKVQEAHLLKVNSLYKDYERILAECVEDLNGCITSGDRYVRDCKIAEQISTNDVFRNWKERFDRKIEDLQTSKIVCEQTILQLQLMRHNNNIIIDKIVSALNGTIPLWRNQISMLWGIEKVTNNINVQDKVADITQEGIKENTKRLRKQLRSIKEIDFSQMQEADIMLEKMLIELSESEKKDVELRNDTIKML